MNAGASQIPDVPSDLLTQLSTGVNQLYEGAKAVNNGTKQVSAGLQTLETNTASFRRQRPESRH